MRGGSQARLVEGQDGHFYVTKFAGNPQGDRVLANEWVARSIMAALGISTPRLRLLRLPSSLQNETLFFEIGNRKVPIEGEWHLGSLCPVDPRKKPIFDFLPERQLRSVSNLNDFGKIFVIDNWLYQLDQRQAIFVRERGRTGSRQIRFRAYLIDHGMALGGRLWELHEATGHGLYMDRKVYSLINMPDVCNETVSAIESLSEKAVFSSLRNLPPYWLSDDENIELKMLLKTLYANRLKLRRMVANQLDSITRIAPF